MSLHLRVVSGLQIGDQGRIAAPGGLIGRREDCALHLRDESVSRSHLELRYQQDGWWAFQQSTRSPSLVDGVPLGSSPLLLRQRGVLQVGGIAVEYTDEVTPAAPPQSESPPTMINVRRQLPTIAHAVLPQMTPLRAAEPAQSAAPPTLIVRRQPEQLAQPAQPAAAAPPTLIRRPSAAPPPIPPMLEMTPAAKPSTPDGLARVEAERDQLRTERDQLAAELRQLKQEYAALRESQQQQPVVSNAPARLAAQALKLLAPFGDSLENASQALQEGDATRARSLVREASFGLADLRDLFEAADA